MDKQLSMSFLRGTNLVITNPQEFQIKLICAALVKSLVVSVEYHSAFYYVYDGRMTFAKFDGSSTNRVQYTYDGLGRLIQYRPATAERAGTRITHTCPAPC